MIETQSKSRDRIAAYHEAGHVVMALEQGWGVGLAYIYESRGAIGGRTFVAEPCCVEEDKPLCFICIHAFAVYLASGSAAETIIWGNYDRLNGNVHESDSDANRLSVEIGKVEVRHGKTPIKFSLSWEAYLIEAKTILEQPNNRILLDALASELILTWRLWDEDITQICKNLALEQEIVMPHSYFEEPIEEVPPKFIDECWRSLHEKIRQMQVNSPKAREGNLEIFSHRFFRRLTPELQAKLRDEWADLALES